MTVTTVPLDARPASRAAPAGPALRAAVSRADLEVLAAAAGIRLPWQGPTSTRDETPEARLTAALGALPIRSAHGGSDRDHPGDRDHLVATGLLHADGSLPGPVRAALLAFARARAAVEVELVARRAGTGSGPARLRAWHRLGEGGVTAVTQVGDRLELAWFEPTRWQTVLAGLARAPGPTRLEEPASGLALPWPLFLASGEALRTGRDDLLGELVARHAGQVLAPAPLPEPAAVRQLRLLHTGVEGQLVATVAGLGTAGDRRLGVVSWLLFGDGWRSLIPHRRQGEPWVRLEPVVPLRLGAEVARLVGQVGGPC